MHALAVILILLGVLAMAGHAVAQRFVLRESILTKSEMLVLQNLIAACFLFGTLPFWEEFGTTHTDNTRLFWIAILGTTVANVAIQWANAHARELADASLTAPIQAMTPMLVTIAAVTIGEYPSALGITGILLISLGTYIHMREKATTLREYVRPFQAFALPANFIALSDADRKQALRDRKALGFAYLSAVCGTVGLIFDGLVVRSGNVALGFGVQLVLLTTVFSLVHIITTKTGVSPSTPFRVRIREHGMVVVGVGVLYGLHVIFIMTAFRLAPIAYVGSLKRLSIIATIFLSWIILKEAKALKRLWPAAIITAGAMFLVFDPSVSSIVAAAHEALR